MIVTKDVITLYKVSKGESRSTLQTLVKAAKLLGFSVELIRQSGGYSTRGARRKLPDILHVKFGQLRFGSGMTNLSGEPSGLMEFAEEVISRLGKDELRNVLIAYHLSELNRLDFQFGYPIYHIEGQVLNG